MAEIEIVEKARAPLLRALLRAVGLSTGAGLLILGAPVLAQGRWPELVAAAIFTGSFLALDLAPLSFRVRAVALLVVWGVGATAVLLVSGIAIAPAFAGFILPLLAALFLGARATVAALTWSLASLAAVGLLGQFGVVTAPPDPGHVRLAYDQWPMLLVAQVILVGPVTLVAQRLVAGLEGAIAERERLIADLRKAQLVLAESERMKTLGLLAGSVVHDLNNTLAVMAAQVDAAPGLGEESRGPILDSIDAAAKLARQVLISAGKVKPELRPLELHEALRPALAAVGRLLPSSVDFRVEGPTTGLRVHADASLLQQALVNLVVNARDAMPAGGRLVVELSRAERGGRPHARLDVRDTGQGMDATTLARAGEPLFTTKPPGQGTGLGLSNVRTTAQAHGGAMEVASEVGVGTRVTLWIPLGEPSTAG